jgi:hypothetical protein
MIKRKPRACGDENSGAGAKCNEKDAPVLCGRDRGKGVSMEVSDSTKKALLFMFLWAVWIGIYARYLAPYTRTFFFEHSGLWFFPSVIHLILMVGIPVLVIRCFNSVLGIIRNRSTRKL